MVESVFTETDSSNHHHVNQSEITKVDKAAPSHPINPSGGGDSHHGG